MPSAAKAAKAPAMSMGRTSLVPSGIERSGRTRVVMPMRLAVSATFSRPTSLPRRT